MSDHRTPGPPSTKTGSAAPETVPSRSAACAAVTDPASRTTGAVAGLSPEPAAACSPAAPYRPATPATSAPRIDHTHSRFPTTVPCHARSSDDTVDSLPAPALDPPALHGPASTRQRIQLRLHSQFLPEMPSHKHRSPVPCS